MARSVYLLLVSLLILKSCNAKAPRNDRRFPDDFLFGVATAAYQIEGGWDADDKGESIWDNLVHNRPWMIEDGTNGDVLADSYHNYKRDVEMMREMGLDAYRFSVSWPRVLPTGFANQVSEAGIEFYNNYINEMLKYNITPMLTLYHWDLPQRLQDLGGWANPLVAEWFADYARVVYENFGDRVKLFITINEPQMICLQGYGDVTKAPALNFQGIGEYLCAKNLLLAHAKAYHLYNDEFKSKQGGQCGIAINTNLYEPISDSEEDVFAAELLRQSDWGLYGDPIFSEEGDFPKDIKKRIAEKSAAQGFPRSRLPELTPEEVDYIRGSSDFYGINHYTAVYIRHVKGIWNVPSYWDDIESELVPFGIESASPWLQEVPWSLSRILINLKDKYNDVEIHITENGWSSTEDLIDDDRIHYYRSHWNGILDALEYGVKVKSFIAWSLMDNMEWMEGYAPRLGLYNVDFEDPARTRTARKSAFVYKELIKTRVVDPDYEPSSLVMTIDEGH